MRFSFGSPLLASWLVLAPSPAAVAAGPADCLPKEAFLVGEVPRGAALVDGFLGSSLWRAVLESDAFAAARGGPDYAKLAAGVALLQGACGTDLAGVARALLGRRAAIGVVRDAERGGPGFVFVSEIEDPVAAESVLAGIEAVARMSGKDALPPPETRAGAEIRAVAPRIFRARTSTHAVVGSSPGLVAAAIDRASAAKGAEPAPGGPPRDLEITLRPGAVPGFLDEASRELPAAFLFGGYVSAFRSAPAIHGSVRLSSGSGLEVTVRAPAPPDGPFFPGIGEKAPAARAPTASARSLGMVRLRRDLAGFWNLRETLLDVKSISGAAQFAGFMSILFSGKDFGDDILPRFGPDVYLIADRQEFPPGSPKPKTPVPAFAAMFHLLDAERFAPLLEVAFQTALGVTNADRGQKGMMPLLIRTETMDGVTVVSARQIASMSGDASDSAWNYSPAAAFAGDRFVLSSTVEFARDLAAGVRESGAAPGDARAGDSISVSGRALAAYLREIEESLVAKNRLDKGNDEAAARRETRILVGLADLAERLDAAALRTGDHLDLKLALTVAAAGGAPR